MLPTWSLLLVISGAVPTALLLGGGPLPGRIGPRSRRAAGLSSISNL